MNNKILADYYEEKYLIKKAQRLRKRKVFVCLWFDDHLIDMYGIYHSRSRHGTGSGWAYGYNKNSAHGYGYWHTVMSSYRLTVAGSKIYGDWTK